MSGGLLVQIPEAVVARIGINDQWNILCMPTLLLVES